MLSDGVCPASQLSMTATAYVMKCLAPTMAHRAPHSWAHLPPWLPLPLMPLRILHVTSHLHLFAHAFFIVESPLSFISCEIPFSLEALVETLPPMRTTTLGSVNSPIPTYRMWPQSSTTTLFSTSIYMQSIYWGSTVCQAQCPHFT